MLWEKFCEVYIRIGFIWVIENVVFGMCVEIVNLSVMFKLYFVINFL